MITILPLIKCSSTKHHLPVRAWQCASLVLVRGCIMAAVRRVCLRSLRLAAREDSCAAWSQARACAVRGLSTEAEEAADGGRGRPQQVSSRRRREGVRLYRHFKPIRENTENKEFGVMMDVLEHDYWCDKERENMPGGWPIPYNPTADEVQEAVSMNDEQVQAGQGEVQLDDPWVNGYLTEDEIMFGEDYKPQPYMPDTVKQQMYACRRACSAVVIALARAQPP